MHSGSSLSPSQLAGNALLRHRRRSPLVGAARAAGGDARLLAGLDLSGHPSHPDGVDDGVLLLVGYGLFLRVLRENRSASRTVAVEPGQRVVATGPYAVVRHPMYAAIAVMGLAAPVALGSWWACIPALLLVAVLAARITNEERLLANELIVRAHDFVSPDSGSLVASCTISRGDICVQVHARSVGQCWRPVCSRPRRRG
jgi:hypothetical protein